MERETIAGPGTAEPAKAVQEAVPQWWPYAREFPHWYVWQGVAGHFYARLPRTSPAVVVRSLTAEDLRAEIARAELSPRPVSSRPYLRNHCA